ncbi:MAG: hypothetical protein PHG66_00720 [Candidatus Colwellbacteria bacterium]|nr:hypothetical protein [Candidatus Colwellbacteria bacterium]
MDYHNSRKYKERKESILEAYTNPNAYKEFKYFFRTDDYVRCEMIEKNCQDFKRMKFQVREGQATNNPECEIQIESEYGHARQVPIWCVKFDSSVQYSKFHPDEYGEEELEKNMKGFLFLEKNSRKK